MSTLLDEETVVLEDLDFEVPCEVVEDGHAAEFAVSCRDCSGVALMCGMHLQVARDQALRVFARPGGFITCIHCCKPSWSFDGLFSVRPL